MYLSRCSWRCLQIPMTSARICYLLNIYSLFVILGCNNDWYPQEIRWTIFSFFFLKTERPICAEWKKDVMLACYQHRCWNGHHQSSKLPVVSLSALQLAALIPNSSARTWRTRDPWPEFAMARSTLKRNRYINTMLCTMMRYTKTDSV